MRAELLETGALVDTRRLDFDPVHGLVRLPDQVCLVLRERGAQVGTNRIHTGRVSGIHLHVRKRLIAQRRARINNREWLVRQVCFVLAEEFSIRVAIANNVTRGRLGVALYLSMGNPFEMRPGSKSDSMRAAKIALP